MSPAPSRDAVPETRGPAARFRPTPARWFELLTSREDLTLAVECLARTGSVELEAYSETTARPELSELRARLEEYHRLAARFHGYWPLARRYPSATPGPPEQTLERALQQLQAWRQKAEPLVTALERLTSEAHELELVGEWLGAMGDSPLRLGHLAELGPALAARLIVLPAGADVLRIPATVMTAVSTTPRHRFVLAFGPEAEVQRLEQELAGLKGRRLALPTGLAADPSSSLTRLREREAQLQQSERALRAELDALSERHQLEQALGDVARLEWFLTHVESLPISENFAWVTGWTSDLGGDRLNIALQRAGVRALVRFPRAPRDKNPPMVLRNPRWARPFEIFARLLGTPARNEADPSALLFVIVPLMFGYMFGDVGQGALLFLAGLLLSKRIPALAILVPAGLASMLFGLLFGSAFGREDLIPALWLHPMEAPLLILALPLAGGALLLLLGLMLNGLEAYWWGLGRLWWRQDAAILLLYVGLIGLLLDARAVLLAGAGLAWFLAGSLWKGWAGSQPLRSLGTDLGTLLENTLQLMINTLSFTRVGAFALAHAGLSLAVVSLADATGSPIAALFILVLGNTVIIALEGLVVSIQITRLVLFEFFIRFLRGEGRGFRPLMAPESHGDAPRQDETRSR